MSERLNDRLRRAHELFRRDQDRLRDELMASLPERMPGAMQDPTQPAVRLVPDVPTELADGVPRETHPIEQPPSRRHVAGGSSPCFNQRRFVGRLRPRWPPRPCS